MKSKAPNIIRLVEDCQNNVASANEPMYKAFYGYVKGVILRYVKVPDDVEELVNDTFIKIFKHINTFSSNGDLEAFGKSFRGWIAKIASRTAIDYIRKQKNNFNTSTSEIEQTELALSISPASTSMEVNDIMALLEQLPETHKLIFNLYEVEGYSHDEIAKMLGIQPSSSRVFLTRAKNRLRTLYTAKFSTY